MRSIMASRLSAPRCTKKPCTPSSREVKLVLDLDHPLHCCVPWLAIPRDQHGTGALIHLAQDGVERAGCSRYLTARTRRLYRAVTRGCLTASTGFNKFRHFSYESPLVAIMPNPAFRILCFGLSEKRQFLEAQVLNFCGGPCLCPADRRTSSLDHRRASLGLS